MSKLQINTDQEFIEFLQEFSDFENNPETFDNYLAYFRLYLYVKTQSKEISDGFNSELLHQYFDNEISVSEAYNTILVEVKKLKK